MTPPLKILHILRSPVGGLFRHVVDLARGQAARGHSVGIVVDSTTGAARAEAVLADLSSVLALGITRIAMSRQLGISDFYASKAVRRLSAAHDVDVVHGHGAKGGAYARLTGRTKAIRAYTPHGGSLHYRPGSALGLIYLTLERALMPRTELFLFESAYGRDVFERNVGQPRNAVRVVHNGVSDEEFAPIERAPDAMDLVFVGELRTLKGVDVLIDALGHLHERGRDVSATIVGDGPDASAFKRRAEALGPRTTIRFPGALPARSAFAMGRILVVPSRAESLPYVVLEAAAAGLPIIATAVGGIAEIFGPDSNRLIQAGDPRALANAIGSALEDEFALMQRAAALRLRVQDGFSVDSMTDHVLQAYADAIGSDRP